MPNFITAEKLFNIDLAGIFENPEVTNLLEVASRYIGEMNSDVSDLFEFDFIVEALKNIEALTSARIEGTTGNLKDLYLEEALDFDEKKQLKLFSAVNYKQTMENIEAIVKHYGKIDLALIRHVHKILTEHDPSTKGTPGKFREKNVIIQNSKLGDFYPANHLKIDELMHKFITENQKRANISSLLQSAISHYQFEAIHPFEDGNGRTGRVLIIAQLLLKKTIKFPVLNLSQTFDKNRDLYVKNLRSVSDEGSYKNWVKFFLTSIMRQCRHNRGLVRSLRDIKKNNELVINKHAHSRAASTVLRHALNSLYITVPNTARFLKQNKIRRDYDQIARYNIHKLVQLGLLNKTTLKIKNAEVFEHIQLKNMLFRNFNSLKIS